MNATDIDRDQLPVEHTAEGDRRPGVVVMTGHGRNKNQLLFVFDGPEGGELVVPFDAVRFDDRRIVLTRSDATGREIKVFDGEHWSQWGAVSDWFESNGIDELPRRFR